MLKMNHKLIFIHLIYGDLLAYKIGHCRHPVALNNQPDIEKVPMKTTLFAILGLLSFVSQAAAAAPNACQAYRTLSENEVDLSVERSVEAYGAQLSQVEIGMIQSVMLIDYVTVPVSADVAVKTFSDAENEGSNGGSLTYTKLVLNSRDVTVVRVTYYPGDNEYGALFLYRQSEGSAHASLIGTVSDGDISCLAYN